VLQVQRCSNEEREAIVDFCVKQPKSAKIEEWKNLPLITEEQRQKWWQSRKDLIHEQAQSVQGKGPPPGDSTLQDCVWENTQEAAPALLHFEYSSARVIPQTHSSSTDHAAGSLETYDQTCVWQPLAPSPIQPQYAHLSSSSQDIGNYPIDSEMPMLSPDAATSNPRPPDLRFLSGSQWRKYF
jgi:hypothetical protein